jgi:hypothetical protein
MDMQARIVNRILPPVTYENLVSRGFRCGTDRGRIGLVVEAAYARAAA